MKVELHIDPSLSQPQAVIYAPANTPRRCARWWSGCPPRIPQPLSPPFVRERPICSPMGDILRFYTDGKGVRCQTVGGGIHGPGAALRAGGGPLGHPLRPGVQLGRSSIWTG